MYVSQGSICCKFMILCKVMHFLCRLCSCSLFISNGRISGRKKRQWGHETEKSFDCDSVGSYICASRVTQRVWVEGFLSLTETVRSPQTCSARRPAAPLQRPTGLAPMTTTSLLVRTHFYSRYVWLCFKTQPAHILYAWSVRGAGWWNAFDVHKPSLFSIL